MKQIIFYRTNSLGGEDGRDWIKRDFETIELALDDALKDEWNDTFKLYEVTLTFNGTITESSEFLGKIPCVRDIRLGKFASINKQLVEEVLNAQVKLPNDQFSELMKMLIEHCNNDSFLPFIYTHTSEYKQYLNAALVWSIKRLEQSINPRINNDGLLVIGDGTCLASAQSYFSILTNNKSTIFESYLQECQDGGVYLQEYLSKKSQTTSDAKVRSKNPLKG